MKKLLLLLLFSIALGCDVLPYNNYPTNSSTKERDEFKTLMEKDALNKKQINAEVLTYLLNDSDPQDKNTAAVIENKSNCDIILRLVGVENHLVYNLPINRNSKNQFVIQKGNYTLKSKICSANYYSQKKISEPLILKLFNN